MRSLEFTTLSARLAICRLPAAADVPQWARGELVSVTRTGDELSLVCDEAAVPASGRPAELEVEVGWRALKVAGPLDFALTGVLVSLTVPLADAGIAVFAIATYDTDYLLVGDGDLDRAVEALIDAGHRLAA